MSPAPAAHGSTAGTPCARPLASDRRQLEPHAGRRQLARPAPRRPAPPRPARPGPPPRCTSPRRPSRSSEQLQVGARLDRRPDRPRERLGQPGVVDERAVLLGRTPSPAGRTSAAAVSGVGEQVLHRPAALGAVPARRRRPRRAVRRSRVAAGQADRLELAASAASTASANGIDLALEVLEDRLDAAAVRALLGVDRELRRLDRVAAARPSGTCRPRRRPAPARAPAARPATAP